MRIRLTMGEEEVEVAVVSRVELQGNGDGEAWGEHNGHCGFERDDDDDDDDVVVVGGEGGLQDAGGRVRVNSAASSRLGARVWGRRWKVWRVVCDAMQILSMLAVGVCSSVKGSRLKLLLSGHALTLTPTTLASRAPRAPQALLTD